MTWIALTSIATVDWHHGDIGTGWWIVMMIGMVAFWALVIYGIVWLVQQVAAGARGPGRQSPREILEERLARGEIDVDEYERRAAALTDPAPSPRLAMAAERDLLVRLRRIEGQVRGVEAMVAGDRPCADVLQQIAAIEAALRQVALRLTQGYVRDQLADGSLSRTGDGDTSDELMRALAGLIR